MSIYALRSAALVVAVAATLAACGDKSSSSRNSSADVQACRSEVQSAALRPGQSDTEAYRAAEKALDACMKRKGY